MLLLGYAWRISIWRRFTRSCPRATKSRLVISPLTRSGPDQAEKWAEKAYALLPRIHLTQLLEEVDGWTQFTKALTHLYTGKPTSDRTGLLTAVLADATNLGKTRMAEATEAYTEDRLAWIEDWYIREGNYARALAAIGCRERSRWRLTGVAGARLPPTAKPFLLLSANR